MKYPIKKEFFPFSYLTPPFNRAFLRFCVPFMKEPPIWFFCNRRLSVSRHIITSYDGERISCFLISPKSVKTNAPCLIFLHGGGFIFEAADYHYKYALKYAQELGCRVLFVTYRLAPRYNHPVFFEDCYSALCWLYDNADELGIDRLRIGIGGDSAGATLSVGVCMMARDRNHPVKFCFQMLHYPFLDARGESESNKKYTDTPMWNSTLSAKLLPMLSLDRENPNYLYFSPVESDNFAGMPPAYIETAEFDCLHDDGILYARLLSEAGISVVLNETKGTMHCFDIAEKSSITKHALKSRIDYMKSRFDNP